MVSPVYWSAGGGMYAAPAVPAMPPGALPPGSPMAGSPMPGSPVIGSPFRFAQPVAGFAAMPQVALSPPAVPLDPGSPAQGWAPPPPPPPQQQQQPQWPAHWQPMPQFGSRGGSGSAPWPPACGFQFVQPGGAGWQWQEAQQHGGGPQFFWDGSTVPGAAARPGAAAQAPPGQMPGAASAPAAVGSPSSGGEASVGSAVGAVRSSPSSPEGGPSPPRDAGLGQLAAFGCESPPGSPTPPASSSDEGVGLRESSTGTSGPPSSSQLVPSETEEQPAEAAGTAAATPADDAATGGAAAPAAAAAGDATAAAAEAAAAGLERMHLS